jgi:aryl-alcohol dehydrogenase-like predicted oxidoreductase
MQYRIFGRTNISISALSFGAGPVSGLMTGTDFDRQLTVVGHAIRRGINWFDSAPGYGAGASERNLGRVLGNLEVADGVHVGTKVRLTSPDLLDIAGAVRRSLEQSLVRLRLPRVTLFQLHNSISKERGDESTSITPADVLGPGGVLEAMEELRSEGLVLDLGLSGIGQPSMLAEVIRSGRFAAMQTPYHLLNPSAGHDIATVSGDVNYGNVISAAARTHMGVLAIRVLAGGAIAHAAPSAHTLKTSFFPLTLYERDRRRAIHLQQAIGSSRGLRGEAVRFALAHPEIHSALIGFGEVQEIDAAIEAMERHESPLTWQHVVNLETSASRAD